MPRGADCSLSEAKNTLPIGAGSIARGFDVEKTRKKAKKSAVAGESPAHEEETDCGTNLVERSSMRLKFA
jgi:hypothetical protein